MQISLAVISFIGSALTYLESANILWMVGGLVIVSVIPFTHYRHNADEQKAA
jgi:hypothetical protein